MKISVKKNYSTKSIKGMWSRSRVRETKKAKQRKCIKNPVKTLSIFTAQIMLKTKN